MSSEVIHFCAAIAISSKAPYVCPAHMQKLKMLEAHSSFPRAQNVVNAVLFLDKLRRRASIKAFPRLAVCHLPFPVLFDLEIAPGCVVQVLL